MRFEIASPKGYELPKAVLEQCRPDARRTGADIRCVRDPREAASHADALYTDVWASMGQEEESEKRKQAFKGYCVSEELMKLAKPSAIFLHCLPAHRGEEVTEVVIEGKQSRVFDQAENRLHAQKALMVHLMADG